MLDESAVVIAVVVKAQAWSNVMQVAIPWQAACRSRTGPECEWAWCHSNEDAVKQHPLHHQSVHERRQRNLLGKADVESCRPTGQGPKMISPATPDDHRTDHVKNTQRTC